MPGARRRRSVALVAALAVGTVLAGCGDDGDDRGSASPGGSSTTAADGGAGTSTSTTGAGTDPTGADDAAADELVGVWNGDAGDILDANLANLGGGVGLTCDGTIAMTFDPDGTFDRTGDVRCSAGPVSANGRVASSGRYAVEGDRLVISDATSGGTIDLAGRTLPLPDTFSNGTATFRIDGSALEITFENPAVGTVTQQYLRP